MNGRLVSALLISSSAVLVVALVQALSLLLGWLLVPVVLVLVFAFTYGFDWRIELSSFKAHAGLTPREADAVLATEPGQRLSAAPSEDTRCFYTFLAKDAVRAVRCGLASGHDGRHSVEEPAASSEAAPVLPPPDLELIDVMQEGEDKTVYS